MRENIKLDMNSEAQTCDLGVYIGSRLTGGEVFELVGDLGAGKTTFTKGLATGAGSSDDASSPTFTVSKVYKAIDLEIHHYDFYRLPEAGLMINEIREVLDDPSCIVVIEWAGTISESLPPNRLIRIKFTSDPHDENVRKLYVHAGTDVERVLEGVREQR